MSLNTITPFEEYLGKSPVNDQEIDLAFTVSKFLQPSVVPPLNVLLCKNIVITLQAIQESEIRPQFLQAVQNRFLPILEQSLVVQIGNNSTKASKSELEYNKDLQVFIRSLNKAVKQLGK